jgi:hypothetical protein
MGKYRTRRRDAGAAIASIEALLGIAARDSTKTPAPTAGADPSEQPRIDRKSAAAGERPDPDGDDEAGR